MCIRDRDGLDVAVIHLPHLSNFTDFNALEHYDGVSLRYVDRPAHLGWPDLILLPGTKNTMADFKWLRESGLEAMIWRLVEEQKVPVIGICGGYQMLGEQLSDQMCIRDSYKASWEDQKIVKGTLTDIAQKVKEAGIRKTCLLYTSNTTDETILQYQISSELA